MSREPVSRALLVCDVVLVATGLIATRSLVATAAAVAAFRLAAVIGALANEWAHIAVALLHGASTRTACTRSNLLGHLPLRTHALACLPGSLDRRGDLFVDIPGLPPAATHRVRVVGFWLSALATLTTAAAAIALGGGPCAYAATLGALLSVAASAATDLASTSPYHAHPTRMGCGNLTLLGRLLPGESTAVPARVGALLEAMLHVTQLRGAQSGGGAVKVSSGGQPAPDHPEVRQGQALRDRGAPHPPPAPRGQSARRRHVVRRAGAPALRHLGAGEPR